MLGGKEKGGHGCMGGFYCDRAWLGRRIDVDLAVMQVNKASGWMGVEGQCGAGR